MITQSAKGKTFVATEKTEALSVNSIIGRVLLPNGERPYVRIATLDAAAATTELIPANATKRIFIIGAVLSGGAAGVSTVVFKSAATAIFPIISLAANGLAVLPLNEHAYMRQPAVNEAINVTVTTTAVGIVVHYIEVPVDVDIP